MDGSLSPCRGWGGSRRQEDCEDPLLKQKMANLETYTLAARRMSAGEVRHVLQGQKRGFSGRLGLLGVQVQTSHAFAFRSYMHTADCMYTPAVYCAIMPI